jgi:hypothetical protein
MGEVIELLPSRDHLELLVVQPKPFELRMTVVTQLGVLDARARLVTDWVRGIMHSGTDGHYIEFWDRDENDERGERHVAHVGDAILQWPDGTWQVIPARDVDTIYMRVGSEMYWGKG